MKIIFYLRVFKKLGLLNVLNVILYRVLIKSILGKLYFQIKKFPNKKYLFFKLNKNHSQIKIEKHKNIIRIADSILNGKIKYYCNSTFEVASPPNWFLDPFNNSEFKNFKKTLDRFK